MSVVLENNPANFDLSKNLMQVKATSDTNLTVVEGVPYGLEVYRVSGSNIAGGTFVFEWETDSITFVLATTLTPDPTDTLVRLKDGGESWDDYLTYLGTRFASNAKFGSLYDFVFDPGGPSLKITAKEISSEYILARSELTNVGLTRSELAPFTEPVVLADVMKIQMKVEVSENNTSSTYVEVATKTQELINGSADFYIQELINPYLEYYIPTFDLSSAFRVLTTYKKVKLTLYERFGNPEVNYSPLVVGPFYVLKAGWPKIDFQLVDRVVYGAIESYYDFNKLFLTRAPRRKKTTSSTKEFLTFLFLTPNEAEPISLKVMAYYEGNKVIESDKFSGIRVANSIYCYPTNSAKLGISLTSGSSRLLYYTVTLVQEGEAVSEVYRYDYDYDNHIAETSYLFTNSDSAVDTVRFTGKLEESSDFDYDSARRLLVNPYDVQAGEFFENKIFKIKKFKQSTGFITKEELIWLDDFLLAEKKFLIGSDSFIPILITSKSKPLPATQQNLYSFEFEYYVAFEDVVIDINKTLSLKPTE